MTMARKTSVLFLVTGICVGAIAVALGIHSGGAESKANQQDLGKLARGPSGTIEIAGSVVDQDGLGLEGFVIQVGEVGGRNPLGSLSKRKAASFDRRFLITRTGVSTIDCIFLKDGYYSERRSFSISEAENDESKHFLSKRDVVIVLQKIPDPAPLEKYVGFLTSNSIGAKSVLYTQKLPLSETPLSAEQLKERKRLNLARPHIYLEPDSDIDGKFGRVFMELEETSGKRAVLRLGRVKLSQPESGDGFFAADFTESIFNVHKGLRKMTRAPSVGYESNLEISVDDEAVNRFFYCRIHGQYGKGVVTNLAPIISRNGIESVTVDIEIFLNPTGSRDVSYIHL